MGPERCAGYSLNSSSTSQRSKRIENERLVMWKFANFRDSFASSPGDSSPLFSPTSSLGKKNFLCFPAQFPKGFFGGNSALVSPPKPPEAENCCFHHRQPRGLPQDLGGSQARHQQTAGHGSTGERGKRKKEMEMGEPCRARDVH